MKNAYPVVTAASSNPVDSVDSVDSSISQDISKDEIDNQTSPIIRLKLDKPLHWYWELTTTADDALPVIQLLDKDGRLLVETTGKTAQRARGSFREGLINYEKFPLSRKISRSTSVNSKREPMQSSGNRNVDGFSNKFGPFEFGYKPRKSRSDASIKVIRDKKIKNKENDKEIVKRYSTGDFLRRQILDDLRTKNMFDKSPDEIAKERCRKVKAYLKGQSDIVHSSNRKINRDYSNPFVRSNDKLDKIESEEDHGSDDNNKSKFYLSNTNDDNVVESINNDYVDSDKLVKIRSFLTEKLRERMESNKNVDNNLTIKKLYFDRKNVVDSNNIETHYRTRKVRSETNVINSSGRRMRFEKENQEDNNDDDDDDDDDEKDMNLRGSFGFNESEKKNGRNVRSISSSFVKKNNYRRSKSDALLVRRSNEFVEQQRKYKSTRRESTDKRRTYRKTKSDLHFDNPNTEKELDRIERSWKDYKERKKLEKLQRESGLKEKDEEEVEEEKKNEEKEDNFMLNKTRTTKDVKRELCVTRNCKVCQNLRNSLGSTINNDIICPFDNNNGTDRITFEKSIDPNSKSSSIIVSPDFGYNSIHKAAFKDYRELYARSNVKKSATFKIIDGSEEHEDSFKEDDDSNLIDDNESRRQDKTETLSLINKSNEDIARDYFKRVYELLKKRQEEARKIAEKRDVIGYDDSSSSNYVEEVRRRKHRRRRRDPAQESTFRVTLQKSSRGLGLSVSGGGTAGPVRVKRLFPLQPAALSNKLQPGDILLAANGIPLTGLTNYEALEVLRTTPNTVELVVCRLPGDTNVTPPGAPPPPPARREPPPPLRIPNPLPPLQIEPCGEFDIEMMKVGGSLGFTLRKADSSALGHYVRALVREPALSDGRIRPGDKIVAVDGAPLSPMSHEEAVALLRQCGPKVKLRLYRDLAQTPVSALSPTEPDHPLRPPRTCLRQEAVDMLCDLAARKLSPGTSSGSSCLQSPAASCTSPRRHRRLATRTPTADNDQEIPEKFHEGQTASIGSQAETSDSDQCSVRTQITNSQANTPISNTDIIIDPPSQYHVCETTDSPLRTPTRPSFLDLSAPQGKPHFQFCSADSDEYPVETMLFSEKDSSCSFETDYHGKEIRGLSSDEQDNDLPSEPASMPPVLSSTSSNSTGGAFSYKNPAYQSANPACGVTIDAVSKNKVTHSSDQDIPGKILGTEDPAGSKGLLKWKGVMFAPSDDMNECEKDVTKVDKDNLDSTISSEGHDEQGNEVFMVELTRGWNSRLGFSLKSEDNHTVISVVHPDSVAARDGRLKQGDVLLMVNDESVESMSTAEIIDLLRKIRGSIGITVMRKNKQENAT
ncbi:uncharacterized protein LOC124952273 isoform X2 [Vespa velutina]|uniref:uncharacterized protein LOC124952273 isoform X2 n=1 Tax=Vespa velutina TaxID=202808 RepID=UPI001FB36D9D|nr:uncharacterized protein LOC124952273 isoform X2 [Vespa velutina]